MENLLSSSHCKFSLVARSLLMKLFVLPESITTKNGCKLIVVESIETKNWLQVDSGWYLHYLKLEHHACLSVTIRWFLWFFIFVDFIQYEQQLTLVVVWELFVKVRSKGLWYIGWLFLGYVSLPFVWRNFLVPSLFVWQESKFCWKSLPIVSFHIILLRVLVQD